MIVAILWAPMIQTFSGLWSYLQQAFAIVVPPVIAIFLAGAFSARVNSRGALRTLSVGHVTGLAVFVANQTGWWPLHFTITVLLMTLFSFGLLFLMSRGGEAPSARAIEQGVWRPDMALQDNDRDGGAGAIVDPRTLAVVAVAGMAATLLIFW